MDFFPRQQKRGGGEKWERNAKISGMKWRKEPEEFKFVVNKVISPLIGRRQKYQLAATIPATLWLTNV